MAVELPFAHTLIRVYLITLISSVHPANITHTQGQGLSMRDGGGGALPRYLPVTSPTQLVCSRTGWAASLSPADPLHTGLLWFSNAWAWA